MIKEIVKPNTLGRIEIQQKHLFADLKDENK